MRVERIITKQGHPVPATAHHPRGPFPPELFENSPIVTDYIPQPDSGGDEIPIGGTAQNNFQAPRWFRCKVCEIIMLETDVSTHTCSE